ncbi:MAPEG family protein [Amphiplicatus metriothermophilus]|uniref:MAPEG family protein n=1 Tax=Amphiplicatus metriothermophilus TaxID=1519374 RepID=UPI000B77F6EA|nr:MAPEG family protein [Amphiplicatus metriothermophilus]MBB5519693.1 putative membrane protein YecN with MAPEG domain [Amphiplicatus metriothermophilus]
MGAATGIGAAGLWIGLNILLLFYLSLRVAQARLRFKVDLGNGGNPEIAKAVRTHANYTEYAPAALPDLVGLAWLGAGAAVIHGLGAVFFFARVSHLRAGHGSLEMWPRRRSDPRAPRASGDRRDADLPRDRITGGKGSLTARYRCAAPAAKAVFTRNLP